MNTDFLNNRKKYFSLWVGLLSSLTLSLVGVISKSTRGVSLDFDGETVKIIIIFDDVPTSEQIEDMQIVEAEVLSTHDFLSDLEIFVLPAGVDLSSVVGNLGWTYLRKD